MANGRKNYDIINIASAIDEVLQSTPCSEVTAFWTETKNCLRDKVHDKLQKIFEDCLRQYKTNNMAYFQASQLTGYSPKYIRKLIEGKFRNRR